MDLFMSHDWPVTITRHGDERRLLQQKPFFRDEVRTSLLPILLLDLFLTCTRRYTQER